MGAKVGPAPSVVEPTPSFLNVCTASAISPVLSSCVGVVDEPANSQFDTHRLRRIMARLTQPCRLWSLDVGKRKEGRNREGREGRGGKQQCGRGRR